MDLDVISSTHFGASDKAAKIIVTCGKQYMLWSYILINLVGEELSWVGPIGVGLQSYKEKRGLTNLLDRVDV